MCSNSLFYFILLIAIFSTVQRDDSYLNCELCRKYSAHQLCSDASHVPLKHIQIWPFRLKQKSDWYGICRDMIQSTGCHCICCLACTDVQVECVGRVFPEQRNFWWHPKMHYFNCGKWTFDLMRWGPGLWTLAVHCCLRTFSDSGNNVVGQSQSAISLL